MYLRTKGEGEAIFIQAAMGAGADVHVQTGFDLTLLRPSVIFGADDHFTNLFAKLQKVLPVVLLAGAQARFQPVWVEDVANAVVRSLSGSARHLASPRVIEAVGPDVFTLKQLVQLSAQLSGICDGQGRPVISLPAWAGRLQATLMELMPGEPMMSLDNLDSMRVDNVATGKVAGLEALGINACALRPIAQGYLRR
jgi:NADH dehydrogenase